MAYAKLLVQLEANIANFSSNMAKAAGEIKKISSAISTIKVAALVNLGQQVYQATMRVYNFARATADAANEIQKNAEIMGVSVETYQKLAYAARMADVDTASFGIGMKFLSRSIEEAARETGDAGKYFSALGISVKDAAGNTKSLETVIYEIADAFKGAEDGSGKLDTAMALLGRSGQQLIPLFNKGGDAIKELGNEAVKLGTILGDVVVKQGSEAEDTFKRLEAQINALKISMAPVAKGFAEMLQSILEIDISKSFGKMKKDFQDMFKDWGEGHFFPIKEILAKAVFDAEEGMAEIKKKIEIVTPPEKGWIKEWVDKQKTIFEELGIKSTEELDKTLTSHIKYMNQIKGQWKAGTGTVLDYVNALKSVTKTLKEMTGEDSSKKMLENEEKYQEVVKEIKEKYPERGTEYQKEINKAIDEWSKVRTKIQDEDPVYIRANLSKWETDLQEALRIYREKFLSQLPQANLSGGGGGYGAGYQTISSLYATNKGSMTGEEADRNFDVKLKFWGEMSPKVPLDQAFDKIAERISGIKDDAKRIDAVMSFRGVSNRMGEFDKLMAVYTNMMSRSTLAWGAAVNPLGYKYGKESEDLANQMYDELMIIQDKNMSRLKDFLVTSGTKLTETIYASFMKFPQYPSGTGFVPISFKELSGSMQGGGYIGRTGNYRLHEGERVISKNVTNSNVTFNISGGDPRRTAEEIAKLLKYKRAGSLSEVL